MFFIQVVHGRPGGRLQFPAGRSKMAWLASAFSSIRARCPKKVRRQDLMMDESGGWLVMRWMSAFLTNSCQRMSRILHRHHWSTASIHSIALLTAQHSDPYSIIGSMETLYRWSLVLLVIRDLHKCRSRLCSADRVTALCLCISRSLLQDETALVKLMSVTSGRWRSMPQAWLTVSILQSHITMRCN